MVTFSIFLLIAAAASVADIESTLAALKLPNASEANTFLYGAHPTAARLYVVNGIALTICTILGLAAFVYGSVFDSCVLFAVLAGVHVFGAIFNVVTIRKALRN